MQRYARLTLGLLLVCGLSASTLRADDETEKSNPPAAPVKAPDAANPTKARAPKAKVKPIEITEEREAVALEFAQQNHPELAKLIAGLKTSKPKEYQKAIRELFRTSERLNTIREKNPERYALEVDAWKLGSQVRLLAARMTMENDPGLEQELRETLGQQADVRLRLLELERDSLNRQLEKVNQRLDTARDSRSTDIESELQKVLHKIDATRAAERRQKEAQKPANTAKPKNAAPKKKAAPAAESKS